MAADFLFAAACASWKKAIFADKVKQLFQNTYNNSEMEELNNGKISIRTRRLSAELCSIRNEETGEELMWQADPKIWGRHCPMLFPTVGSVWNGKYRHRGVIHEMSKHGFLQNTEFELKSHESDSITYITHDTAETRAIFPFKFSLEQKFTLVNKTVKVEWTVRNVGCDDMPFHIGGHPSFYFRGFKEGDDVKGYLQFDKANPESATVGSGGCLGDERYVLPAPEGLMALHDEDFKVDSIIMDHDQVHAVILLDKERKPVVKVSSGAPVFLVWSPWGVNAPFVCLEPWYGLCDKQGYEGEFSQRPYTNVAPAYGEWHGGYDIEIM